MESKKDGLYEDDTKTSDRRTLKLPPKTMDLLKELQEKQRQWQVQYGEDWVVSGYVFCRENGSPTRPDTVTSWLRDFSAKFGFPHINPHAFRHTLASVLLANGFDIVTVSKYPGHSNVNTTGIFTATSSKKHGKSSRMYRRCDAEITARWNANSPYFVFGPLDVP